MPGEVVAPVRATGIGSWPGTSAREAVRTVRDLLVDGEGVGLPHCPETPARGPGADIIGRAAGLLVDLPVDLQPSGWRFVDRPGLDAGRTASFHREDLDELAEAYDGYVGALKVQVAGPWTLAASLRLNRGERVVADPGAVADLVASLADGIQAYVSDVRRLVPGAEVVLHLTVWPEFRQLSPEKLGELVKAKIIIDGRLKLHAPTWRDAGWKVVQIGRAASL